MAGLAYIPVRQVRINSSGRPHAGAKAYFYAAGTTTPRPVYTTSSMSVAHPNPVVANSAGVFPAVYLDPRYTYRCITQTSAGTAIDDEDNIPGSITQYLESDPRRYGAAGDGATDDTEAFQRAIDSTSAGGMLTLPDNAVFGFTSLTFSRALRLTGGRLRMLPGSASNGLSIADALDGLTVDGVEIDLNGVSRNLVTFNGSRNFKFTNNRVINGATTVFSIFGSTQGLNVGMDISGNYFECNDANGLSPGTIYSVSGLNCHGNEFKGYNLPSFTNNSTLAYTAPPYPGSFRITNNRVHYIANTGLTLILIRANANLESSGILIANNVLNGGKIGINVAEENGASAGTEPDWGPITITGNYCVNNTDVGITLGASYGLPRRVIVSNNQIGPGENQALTPNRGIDLTNVNNYSVVGNVVTDCDRAGIVAYLSDNGHIANNTIVGCANAPVSAGDGDEGGIYIYDCSRLGIKNNTILNSGGSGTSTAAGIAFYNAASDNVMIQGNLIDDDRGTPYQNYCIRLTRAAGSPHPSNITITDNYLGAQAAAGSKIYVRADTHIDQRIFGNKGWGDYIGDWNPGAITDGATATTTVTVNGALTTDTVQLFFNGLISQSGLTNRNKWLLTAHVSAANTVTVALTNLTGSSQTFDTTHKLRLQVERHGF